jgi:hypothetical protein
VYQSRLVRAAGTGKAKASGSNGVLWHAGLRVGLCHSYPNRTGSHIQPTNTHITRAGHAAPEHSAGWIGEQGDGFAAAAVDTKNQNVVFNSCAWPVSAAR